MFAQKSNDGDDQHAKSKKPFVCNHPHHPLSLRIGGLTACRLRQRHAYFSMALYFCLVFGNRVEVFVVGEGKRGLHLSQRVGLPVGEVI